MKIKFSVFLWLVFLIIPAISQSATIDLVLQKDDIASIQQQNGVFWLKLNSTSSKKLSELTSNHYGYQLVVSLENLEIVQADVVSSIQSGIIEIQQPKSVVKEKLFELMGGDSFEK